MILRGPNSVSRRAVLAVVGLTLAGTSIGARVAQAGLVDAESDPWTQADAIVASLSQAIAFPDREFDVRSYGAAPCATEPVALMYKAAGVTGAGRKPAPNGPDCRQAFADAINACHAAGGGRVLVPPGDWYCAGPIVLLSGVNFHLDRNTQIWFSPDPADYARYGDHDCGPNGKLVRSRWQGNDCLNFSAMVYAVGQTNIALTGEDWTSVLNGQAGTFYDAQECWWSWKTGRKEDAASLPAMSEADIPLERRVFGLGHHLLPCMIEFLECSNVLMQGYQVINTPFWQHHPIACRNVVIRDVYANSLGANNDGFDPESCDRVLCERVTFNTGDDCIAIKSGKNRDTTFGAARDHVIQNCVMNSGHGGITLGSEQAAGIQNIFARDLRMTNENWATRPLNVAIRIKANMNRGGIVENFHVRNVSLPNGVCLVPHFYNPLAGGPMAGKSVSTIQGGVVTIDCDYQPENDPVRTRPPIVRNVSIAHVVVSSPPNATASCYQAFILLGPIASDYNGSDSAPTIRSLEGIVMTDCDFGTPADESEPYFLYNVHDLTVRRVKIDGKSLDGVLRA